MTDESTAASEPILTEEVDAAGLLRRRFTMRDGVLDGRMETFDAEGRPEAILSFALGVLHGPATTFQHGRPVLEMSYRDGLLEGEVHSFDPAGRRTAVVPFQGGRKQGVATVYYPDGAPMRVETYAEDLLHGPVVDYHPDGSVRQEAHYVGGLLQGDVVTYAPDGVVTARLYYVDGVEQAAGGTPGPQPGAGRAGKPGLMQRLFGGKG